MPKTVKVTVEVPEDVGEPTREIAETKAHEAAVLSLWQQQALTIREAAEELGLTYREFLDLLAARGLPIERGSADLAVLEETRQKLAGGPA